MHYKILKTFPEFIVVLKPHGMLSIPARDKNDQREVLGKLLELELNTQIFPVHRLDFEVAGIMLYALSPNMHKLLSLAFERQEIHKTYLAYAENHAANLEPQEWKSVLLKGKKRTYEAAFGKPSTTIAQGLENIFGVNNVKYSKWKLSPLTGRSHQLRYEMMKHGHTILGDQLYGSKIDIGLKRIALFSISIQLPKTIHADGHLSLDSEEVKQLTSSIVS